MNKLLTKSLPLSESNEHLLERYFRKMFKNESIRLVNILNEWIFLMLGKQKTGKDSLSLKRENRKVQGNASPDEITAAFGHNVQELIVNAKEYKAHETEKREFELLLEEIEDRR